MAAPPSPPSSPAVGRGEQLRRLRALLAEAQRGHPRVVLVTGEPGIGKTRLLEDLADYAATLGCTTMAGRAAEFEEVPFGVFADALAPAWRPPTSDVDSDSHRLYREVTSLLGDLTPERGLLVVLDDLHWADDGSIGLIDYLLRHPPPAPILFALALRERQAPISLLGTLARVPVVIDLPPLSPAEMDELIPAGTSAPRRAELHHGSGGNPFYLGILLRDASNTDGSTALRGELAALSTSEQGLARAAAIAGDTFDPELLSAVARVPVPTVLSGLDELARCDLVRPDGARRFRFRHPLLRNAVYHTVDAAARREGHARAAGHLRERGADATARAHHVERAARPGDEDAVTILVEAAEHVLATVPALAGHWFEVAADLVPAGPKRAGLILRQAAAIGATGDFARSRDLAKSVLNDLVADHNLYAGAVTLCATMERSLGNLDAAAALLHKALSQVDEDCLGAGLLKAALAEAYARAGRLLESLDWIVQARQSAEGRADLAIVGAGAAALMALGHAYAGDFSVAQAQLDYAVPLLDGITDRDLAAHLPVVGLAWAEVAVHRFEDGRRHFARGVTIARRTGQHITLASLLTGLAGAEIWLGRLAEAGDHAADATEFARALNDLETIPLALGCQAEAAYMRGDLAAAKAYALEAIQKRPDTVFLWSGFAEAVLAKVMLAEGDPAGCVEQLLAAGGGPELSTYAPGMRAPWYDVLVQAELARGNIEAATGWADRSQAMEAVFGAKYTHAISQARLQVAMGDYGSAIDFATFALEYVVAIGAGVVEADHRRVLAAALAGAGRIDDAEEELRRAKALLAERGAIRMHAEVVADQRKVAAARPRSNGCGLTNREREIAGLVAAGRTNQQIATQLAISPRTVENHLTRIFAKFGVTSRAAVAGRLAQDT
ncbi:AAA family ATPase [Actinocrispum sp. NPDC049592]|uniref:helix-turn-helix transcriptional regulator n=1 Tax=Actinocrispum sp. NPDC049592 TaxID=3154835 RepID=UPI00341F62C4